MLERMLEALGTLVNDGHPLAGALLHLVLHLTRSASVTKVSQAGRPGGR